MEHKTLIGGTAYKISGCRTLINGTGYSIAGGRTRVGGTGYDVSFVSWPDDLDTGLEFVSANAFTLSVASPGWDGAMEYCNGRGWKEWDGSEIKSRGVEKGQCIYVRGTGNTQVSSLISKWTVAGAGIECNGNIENLLDYATVTAGQRPVMSSSKCYSCMFYGCTSLIKAPSLPATTLADYCYHNMFRGCTSLIKAPSLPATTLADYCYSYMFYGCTSLTEVPNLPATTLADYCYSYMFYDCAGIKLSATKSGEYQTAYRIPTSGTGTKAEASLAHMFKKTGGTFTDTPKINTTYYLHSSNTII